MYFKSFVISVLKYVGIDKAIAYSSGTRVIQAFTGIGSIYFISTFLTGIEQGFYFTFGSLLAIQVFFELGLNNIITQFSAHENAKIEYDNKLNPIGCNDSISRLSSIVHFSFKWYSIIAVLFYIIVTVAGIVFFKNSENTNGVSWLKPWLFLSLMSSINLFISPFYAILNGIGYIKQVSKIRFFQQIFIPLSSWIGLVSGFKLYVLGISLLVMFLVGIYIVLSSEMIIKLRGIWRNRGEKRINYRCEVFPLQWKMALSWISGYFIYQLFNPILFHYAGAEVAGKMGMTMQVLNAIQAFSFSWMGTKIPRYSTLIAQKRYLELDKVFSRTLKQLLLITSVVLITFIFVLTVIDDIITFPYKIDSKFLSGIALYAMCFSIISNQTLSSFANYLRCHKKEPLVLQSVVVSILCALSSLTCTKYWGVNGMTVGYTFIMTFISLPWIYSIYKRKKYEWHQI
ncbi:MAG: hypothetical protein SNG35_01400 [Rikenellaceae bacterium]